MIARTLFWPLLRHATGIDQTPKLAWNAWAAYYLLGVIPTGCVPLLLLLKVSQGNLATFFTAFSEFLGCAHFVWLVTAGSVVGAGWIPFLGNRVGQHLPVAVLL
mgnify:CR=1 FL=1